MSDSKKYVTEIFPVKLAKKDIPRLLQDTSKMSGLVTIVQGDSVMSAKSLLGLLNVDYQDSMEMLIQAYLTNEELETLKSYELIEKIAF